MTLRRCGKSNSQSAQADVILYQPETALRLHYPEEFDKRQPVGDNPPPGAIIDYYFKTAPKDEVTLDILDPRAKSLGIFRARRKKKANSRRNGQIEWNE